MEACWLRWTARLGLGTSEPQALQERLGRQVTQQRPSLLQS